MSWDGFENAVSDLAKKNPKRQVEVKVSIRQLKAVGRGVKWLWRKIRK